MKNDLTELVLILDRSGSMSGLETDTIGGFNSMLDKQRSATGNALVTTVLFDHDYEVLHNRLPLQSVAPITDKEYFVRGNTALLDAVGKTILNISALHKNMAQAEVPSKVLFVITTDGFENASREFTYRQIKIMIEEHKSRYDWEFIFLGANIDAAKEAGRFGISEDHSVQYHNDAKGVALNFEVVSEAVTTIRAGKKLNRAWKEKIETDFQAR